MDALQMPQSRVTGKRVEAIQKQPLLFPLSPCNGGIFPVAAARAGVLGAGETLGDPGAMAVEAWLIDESDEDQRLPHHRDPKEYVSMSQLEDIGILYWHLDPKNYDNDEELKKIREARGYSYMDFLELGPGKVDNYEEKLKCFFREHIHADEEIRYCFEGGGYFDVRGKDDQWIRIWIKEGDLIVLPAGIYHRFTLDTSNYVKLMRLFVGEPVWTAYNRPQEEHPARKGYVKGFLDKSGAAVEAL